MLSEEGLIEVQHVTQRRILGNIRRKRQSKIRAPKYCVVQYEKDEMNKLHLATKGETRI